MMKEMSKDETLAREDNHSNRGKNTKQTHEVHVVATYMIATLLGLSCAIIAG